MEADTTNLENFDRLDENLTEFTEKEKDKLSKLILARISVINQCKRTLTYATKILIENEEKNCKLENVEEKYKLSLENMDNIIDSMIKLLSKDKYNTQELFIINNIFLNKLVSPPIKICTFGLRFHKNMILNCVPINIDHYEKKMYDFKKYNIEKISLILMSQDKSFYVTGGEDGVIRIWDKNGFLRDSFYDGQEEITALTLSADGNYVVSGSIDGKLSIINLKSPDSSLKNYNEVFKKKKILNIYYISISAKNQYVIFTAVYFLDGLKPEDSYKTCIIDIINNIYTYSLNFRCIIREIGNIEYILGHDDCKLELYKLNILPKEIKNMGIFLKHRNRRYEYFGYCIDSNKKSLGLSKSGKYVVHIHLCQFSEEVLFEADYEIGKFFIMKLNLPVIGHCINKCEEVVGVSFKKSKFFNNLKIEKQMKYENSHISEDLEYIVLISSETAYVWSTSKNEIISQKHIGKNQAIYGVSHSFMFIGNLKNELICSNFKTNDIKFIQKIYDFNNIKRVSITKDLEKFIIYFDSTICVLDTDTGIIIWQMSFTHLYDFYVTNRIMLLLRDREKFKFYDLKTGKYIVKINIALPYVKYARNLLGSADGRYLCFVSNNREYKLTDEVDFIEKKFQYIFIDTKNIDNFLLMDFKNKNIHSWNNFMKLMHNGMIPIFFDSVHKDHTSTHIKFSEDVIMCYKRQKLY